MTNEHGAVETNLKQLLYFVKERECIRKLKVSGAAPPWTQDKILAQYRFCNIRRSDDRVSRWLIQNVLKQEFIDYDLRSFLLFSAWCRTINWPPTIKAALDAGFYPERQIDWKRLGQFVDALPGKVWTGAFMVRASRKPGQKKGEFVSERTIGEYLGKVLPEVIEALQTTPLSYQRVWKAVSLSNGQGSFMSGQIVTDWSYTSLLNKASDLFTWAPTGPGSIRGYNRILGITSLSKPPRQEDWLSNLVEWRQKIIECLGPEYENLTAHDVQNCLCELHKLLKTKEGSGRPRSKYRPERAY